VTLARSNFRNLQKKWPIDYVLDGQQRLTSLFGVFQNTLQPSSETDEFEIYFDLNAKEGALEDQFIAASKTEDTKKPNLFSLRLLFDPTAFALKTRDRSSDELGRLVELQRRFQESQIKYEVIEFDDREQIAMIFERVNRAGVPLDTFQLLTAWTWSEEFDLNEKIENLGSEVAPYGFSRIGEQQDLLLKCAAAVISGDASVKSIVTLHGPTVRDKFELIQRGILGAIDFLRRDINVHSLEIMPYPAMLVPLARFFSTDALSGFHPNAKQRDLLIKWFWRSCFTRRYSSGVNKAHEADIRLLDAIKNESAFELFVGEPSPGIFIFDAFNIGTVNTKIFVLMLAAKNPKSLISNSDVDLEDALLRCNRNEFHHIFPRAYLISEGYTRTNMLANFCFLSAADNQKIKDRPPSEYIKFIEQNLRSALASRSLLPEDWFKLPFEKFILERTDLLIDWACELSGLKRRSEYVKGVRLNWHPTGSN
jgi:hypothetical protein